ncbi:MAG: hypothetical protein ACI38U_04490 [Corynebacterium sp.]|uniref:hypothetical protein n=1 Tax=Corynebacterium sp. TaxID=1720 RepID=UPI003F02E543
MPFDIRRGRGAAVVAVSGLIVLSACGSEEPAPKVASSTAGEATQRGEESPLAPDEAILTADDAPDGYESEGFYSLFEGWEPDNPGQVMPAECSPLVFDTSIMTSWGVTPQDNTAVASYTSEDASKSILVRLDTQGSGPSVPDPESCSEVQLVHTEESGTVVTTYEMTPVSPDVEDADRAAAVGLTVTGRALDGEEMPVEGKIGEHIEVVVAAVGDSAVTAVGTGAASMETVMQLANAQVSKLGARAGRHAP